MTWSKHLFIFDEIKVIIIIYNSNNELNDKKPTFQVVKVASRRSGNSKENDAMFSVSSTTRFFFRKIRHARA